MAYINECMLSSTVEYKDKRYHKTVLMKNDTKLGKRVLNILAQFSHLIELLHRFVH